MRVAIYAEGRTDLAVIRNILKGKLNIDSADIKNDLPEYDLDQTDLATMEERHFSTWTLVKDECQKREKINLFLETFEQDRFIIIQIDSFERNQVGYDVPEPVKGTLGDILYCDAVYQNISAKINEWMDNNHLDSTVHAITIEELEAWLLPIYERDYAHDTSRIPRPKERLQIVLNRVLSAKEKKIFSQPAYDRFLYLSHPFRKKKNLTACSKRNRSLAIFCAKLEKFDT